MGDKDWKQLTETGNFNWNDMDAIFDTSGDCIGGCILSNGMPADDINLTGYICENHRVISKSPVGESRLSFPGSVVGQSRMWLF